MLVDLNIIESMTTSGEFRVFTLLIKGSLFEMRLRSESPLTLFAPTDIAFIRLPTETIKWLLKSENQQKLEQILAYHVVRGRLDCKQLEQIETARTEQGQDLRIDLRQTLLIDSAKIVLRDIDATNGVIHGIDSLLVPCAVSAAAN
jgi:uncharacterized surface protein with fasciclin (FAS1) repeats